MSAARFVSFAVALAGGLTLLGCTDATSSAQSVSVQSTKYLASGTLKCPGPDVVIPFDSNEGSSYVSFKLVSSAKVTVTAIAEISTPANWTNLHPDRPDKLYVDFRSYDKKSCNAGGTLPGTPATGSPNTPYYATMQSELAAGQYAAYVLQPWFWDEITPTRLHLSCSGDSAATP